MNLTNKFKEKMSFHCNLLPDINFPIRFDSKPDVFLGVSSSSCFVN